MADEPKIIAIYAGYWHGYCHYIKQWVFAGEYPLIIMANIYLNNQLEEI